MLEIYNANTGVTDLIRCSYHIPEQYLSEVKFLISYHYYKRVDPAKIKCAKLMADSGGFSAYTQGAEIDIQTYINWIQKNRHYFSHYINLDVIGDPQATMVNQKIMEDAGLNPIPVFHVGSDWQYLEDLIENYDYIALGGMVPHALNQTKLIPWVIKCFKIIQQSGKEIRVHGLGCTSIKMLRLFPWYSVDSSICAMGPRYGQIYLFDRRTGNMLKLNLRDVEAFARYSKLIETMGFDWKDFAYKDRYNRPLVIAFSIVSMIEMERWIVNVRRGSNRKRRNG